MCWNWKVSIGTYALICGVSYTLFTRNLPYDRLLAIFILSYGTMQLFEALMWLGQNPGAEDLNKIGSLGAAILLYTHPLAVMIGFSFDKVYKSISGSLFDVGIIISLLWFGFGLLRVGVGYVNQSYSFLAHPDAHTHNLIWDFPEDYITTMIIITIFAFVFIYPHSKLTTLLLAIYYGISIGIIYFTANHKDIIKNKTLNHLGSYWCWYVAAFSFLFYFVNPIIQNS